MKNLILITVLTISQSVLIGQSHAECDSLKTLLENILMKDQTLRRIYKEAENKLGKESEAMEYFWEVVEAQDKILEKEVLEIIDKYGWLGISQVGQKANTAQWAVLQHGSVASKEKYAPLLKKSMLLKESQPSHYARLVDRMLINSSKPQLYGTQYEFDKNDRPTFFPIEDPKNIDQRRREIGLKTMKEFANSVNAIWND